jgi:hypothetical protein
VNGTLPPLMVDAPEKAGEVLVGLGMPLALFGLRTLRLVRIRSKREGRGAQATYQPRGPRRWR